MPNTKSSEKRVRQNTAHRTRNRTHRSAMRTQVKKTLQLIEDKDTDKLAAEMVLTQSTLDKAVAAGLVHRNKAARAKARMAAAAAKLNVKA